MGKSLKTLPSKTKKTSELKASKNAVSNPGSIRKASKPHRFRPGTVAKREIKRLQKSIEYCLRKAPFQRLCREIGNDLRDDFAMTKGAKDAFQHAAEDYLVNYLKAGYVVAEKGSRRPIETLKPRHTRTANDVALCFPGKPVDHSFAERDRALFGAAPKKTKKTKKESKKESKDKVEKEDECASASTSNSV